LAVSYDGSKTKWQDAQQYCRNQRQFPSSVKSITKAEKLNENISAFSQPHWTGVSRRLTVVKTSEHTAGEKLLLNKKTIDT